MKAFDQMQSYRRDSTVVQGWQHACSAKAGNLRLPTNQSYQVGVNGPGVTMGTKMLLNSSFAKCWIIKTIQTRLVLVTSHNLTKKVSQAEQAPFAKRFAWFASTHFSDRGTHIAIALV